MKGLCPFLYRCELAVRSDDSTVAYAKAPRKEPIAKAMAHLLIGVTTLHVEEVNLKATQS
jgi:hypothetical protein